MNTLKREKLSAQLPPTSVTPSTRQRIMTIAVTEGVSINTVVRAAVEFFLRDYERKTLNNDSKSHEDKSQ